MNAFFRGILFSFLLPVFSLEGAAQKRDFHFFPVNGIEPGKQAFVGRLGSHFFLVNPAGRPGLGLYIYDTTQKQAVVRSYPFPSVLSAVVNTTESLLFVALQTNAAGTTLHLLELDETGMVVLKKETLLDTWRAPVSFTSSSDKKLFLVYQLKKKSPDSVVIKGYQLDDAGQIRKSILYTFRHNTELDAEPEILLDILGNTHILVYDRFTNYRLSTDLSVNTIPFKDEVIVSETFTLEKVKLRNMRVFQNNECRCIQAEGIYADGLRKGNKGIYSIAFPPGRKNELAPRFIPFHDAMIRNLKQGFSATGEMVRNSLQLQEIIYSDSGSFAILRVAVGTPQKVQSIRPEDDGSAKWANQAMKNSRAGDVLSSANPNATPATRSASRVSSMQQADRSANSLPLGTMSSQPPVMSKSYGRNAPKLICIKLDKDEGFDWMQSLALDVFIETYDMFNQVSLARGGPKEVSAMFYQGDKNNDPLPVWVSLKDGSQTRQEIPIKKLWLSPFLFLNANSYASLYFNYETGSGGLLVNSPGRL